jgi:hypothetical protein
MGVVTRDEYAAPVLAFWHRGLGRVASLTAEVDGAYSGRLNAWRDFGAFSVGLGRWLLGGDPPSGVRATIERQGGQGIVRVELDPGRTPGSAGDIRSATALMVPPGDVSGAPQRLALMWTGEDVLEARFPVQRAGLYLGAVQLGTDTVLPLAPLTLPYSPEFEPRPDPREGPNTLAEIARITGGAERTSWDDAFSASRLRSRQVRDLVLPLALLLLALHLIEIAGRRLLLFDAALAWMRTMRVPSLRPVWTRGRIPAPAAAGHGAAERPVARPPGDAPPVAPAVPPPATSPLARAKARARRRMGG